MLTRYRQSDPLVVCLQEETPRVLDGFSRPPAGRTLPRWTALGARLMAADERAAKAAIRGLHRGRRPTQELEDAWIVLALVREDGPTQVETAELLRRHRSWVCRRLALLQRLDESARDELRLGPTAARALVPLLASNQIACQQPPYRIPLPAGQIRGILSAHRYTAVFVVLRNLNTRVLVRIFISSKMKTRSSPPIEFQGATECPAFSTSAENS